MSGFSIELLDEGCRAVDPVSRMSYEVHRAPEDGRSTSVRPSAGPPRPAGPGAAPPQTPQPPQALVPQPVIPQPVATQPTAAQPAATQALIPQPVAPQPLIPQTIAAPSEVPSRSRPPISASATMMIRPKAAVAAPVTPPIAAPAAETSAPLTARAGVVSSLPSQIVFKREQDATEALPLTYREYVYVVPPGSTEAAATTLVHSQFDLVRASLDRMPAGKLVNLAVFDMTFQGKPPVPPLATLVWKDWRGAALVSFPRQPARAPVPIPTAPITLPPPAVAAHPEPVHPSRPPPPVVPVQAPVAQARPVAPPQVFAPAPVFQPAPLFPPPQMFAPTPAPAFVEATAPLMGATVVPYVPMPAPVFTPAPPMGRVHGEDLIADLFESMHDLHFARDAVEGGDFCLALAMEKLASLIGIVQLYDINRREFLVTNTRGAGTSALLLRRFPETDALLAAAMQKRSAVVIEDASQSEAATNERYVVIGGARSLIVAPVMLSGRFLGAIELLNPADGKPFTESDGNAVTYIARAARGVRGRARRRDRSRAYQRAPATVAFARRRARSTPGQGPLEGRWFSSRPSDAGGGARKRTHVR